VRVRLIEIGEAVKDIDPELLAAEPNLPWGDVFGMRDHLAHRYFDTDHALVTATVQDDLPSLVAAVTRLSASLDDDLDSLRGVGSPDLMRPGTSPSRVVVG